MGVGRSSMPTSRRTATCLPHARSSSEPLLRLARCRVEFVTDKAATYPTALAAVVPGVKHRTGRYRTNGIERDHGFLKKSGCGQCAAAMFMRAHALMRNIRHRCLRDHRVCSAAIGIRLDLEPDGGSRLRQSSTCPASSLHVLTTIYFTTPLGCKRTRQSTIGRRATRFVGRFGSAGRSRLTSNSYAARAVARSGHRRLPRC